MKWSVYQSDKYRVDSIKEVVTTSELIWWLLFGKTPYIVNINRIKEDK